MGFDWGVSISLQYCVPIKLDDKVSFWYMLKRLAEYEPGFAKRAHQAMLITDPIGVVLLKKATQCVIVLTNSAQYDENEVEKEVESPTPLEARFHYHPRLVCDRVPSTQLPKFWVMATAYHLNLCMAVHTVKQTHAPKKRRCS